MSGDSSSSGNAAGGGIGELEDLEQRLADRMDAALNQRMDVMMQKFSSMLQGASIGGGDRSESGGGGSAATGGNQFVPGAQSGAPGGAEMSSIPGRPPTPVGLPRGVGRRCESASQVRRNCVFRRAATQSCIRRWRQGGRHCWRREQQ